MDYMKYIIKDTSAYETELIFHPDGADEGKCAVYIFPQEGNSEGNQVSACCIVTLEELRKAIEWLVAPPDCN